MRFTILYVPGGRAAIDLWVTRPGQPLVLTCAAAQSEATDPSSKLSITLRHPSGDGPVELNLGQRYECAGRPGMWQLSLAPKELADPGRPVRLEIAVEGAYPFTVPGPGVIPSHFRQGRPWLRFPASPETGPQFYLPVPDALDSVYLGGWLKGQETLEVEYADGSTERIRWHLVEHVQHGVVVPVNGRGGWWRITLLPTEQEYYVTTGWTGLPLFLQRPPSFFPFAEIEAGVVDEQGRPVDARLSLYRDGDEQAIRVAMDGQSARLYAVPGQLSVVASRGLEYRASARGITAEPGSRHALELTVTRTIARPEGWLCGDHHVHSYYEDGALAPAQIAQAARGEGLDYMFLTDTPDPLLPAGLQQYNAPRQFLALPGQELGNPQCHFNALNTRHHIDHPPFGTFPEAFPGPGEWIPQVEAQATPEHPTAYMLNHPAHFAELTARVPYFRSWWLVDAHPEITVIENSPFEPWYERLNAGRRITHLWTTDSHDAGLLPPGSRRTYIFTGGAFSEQAIVDGIRSGRSFNAREPGAWLDFSVNGAAVGGSAPNPTGTLAVRCACQASIPLSHIELICNGKCLHTWRVDEARSFSGEIALRAGDARWLIAIVYADHTLKHPDQHVNPLDMEGLLAFTNPVYVDAP